LTHDAAGALHADADDVHRVRVSTRRLREALALVSGPRRDDARRLRDELGRLRTGLGEVREADVMLGLLEARTRRAGWTTVAVGRVRRSLIARRSAAARGIGRLLNRVDLASVVGRTLEVAAAFERTPRRREVNANLTRRARTRARALITAIRAAGPLYEPSRFHEARIAAKKLRYVLELVRDLGRMPVEKEIGALRAAQDTLGELHDLQDLQRAVDAVAATTPPVRSTRLALATISTALAAECRKRHAGFLEAEPAITQLARRIQATSVGIVRARPSRMIVKPGATLRPGGGPDAVKGVFALPHPSRRRRGSGRRLAG
jgi:CHAD domain-containing protein